MNTQLNLPQVLTLDWLRAAYASGQATPESLLAAVLDRIERHDQPQAWISRLSRQDVLAQARRVALKGPERLPLYGVPFAIKDNIDLAGVPTTAACPAYAYTPEKSAPVVERLLAAGAIVLGKTNLDQFATGLVGTRTPFGACHSVFSRQHVSGGSSSGSAVVVAAGLASFALGTDTAGSGRIPAAFNNLLGWKPSRGLLSSRGVVPACRSLDCVSVFALNAADADVLRRIVAAPDADDPFSRTLPEAPPAAGVVRLGIPRREQWQWFGDEEMQQAWQRYLVQLQAAGIRLEDMDYGPWRDAARLLYEGPWLAERQVAVGEFIQQQPEAVWPVTRQIIGEAPLASAADYFRADYRRQALRAQVEQQLRGVDAVLLPTAGRHFRLAEIEQEPLRHNSTLGYYTNYMNLLDLAGVAVPAGFREDGLPFGVTLCAAAGSDGRLLQLAGRLHQLGACGMGIARQQAVPEPPVAAPDGQWLDIAVCGAHLSGLPLNGQLQERGARLHRTTRTAAHYRLYALPGTIPPKPGLVRSPGFAGPGIEVEVWSVPMTHVGSFLAGIPAPLGLGRIQLEDGSEVTSFLCEAAAVEGAQDISAFGGWRAWLASSRGGS